MKLISLTQGKVVKISDHRFEEYNQWKWHAKKQRNGKFYAMRWQGKWPNRKLIRMHRQITNAPDGMELDHWDGDGLNNQDENLRICTKSQNMANRGRNHNNISGYKGVSRHGKKWRAEIHFEGKDINLKSWDTPEEAASAYDKAAKHYHGEFANLNFPE